MTDPVAIVYSEIVARIRAEPLLYDATGANKDLIRDSTLIVYNGTQPFPEKANKNPGDLPELEVDVGTYVDTPYGKMVTFAVAQGAGCDWREQFTINYVLTLTMPDRRLTNCAALSRAIVRAIGRAGPRLDHPDLVASWGPVQGNLNNVFRAAPPKTPKRQAKITVPVAFNFAGASLLNS